ncbi:MAG: sugar transferase [Candidatus Kaiserbacteria bacterium]|nr:sugar transferase [Candidatus Kaiserbacteria bacterium]
MAFSRRETAILLMGDFLILVASLWVALLLRNLELPSFGYLQENFWPFLPMFFLSLGVFYVSGLYEKQTRPIRSVMGIRIFGAQIATVVISAILFFTLPFPIAPQTILILYLIVSVAAESSWRFYWMNREIKEGRRIPALLIGSGAAVLELYDEVYKNDRYLIRFVEHVETKNLAGKSVADTISSNVMAGIRTIIIDMSDPKVVHDLLPLYNLMADGVSFLGFSSLYEEIFDRVPLQHLAANELLGSLQRRYTFYDLAKRIFDIALALIGISIALPFVGVAAALLLVGGGMPFVMNERIGRGGRTFHIIKLRSMLFNDHGNPELQKENRVTAFGRFLRKSRIDELPQLWNVLVGDLSFIGPRPELPKIAEVYDREIPQYRIRHLIAPGLSGWAQIHDYDAPRGPADVVRTNRKVSYDLYYLKRRSFGLDLAIAIKTLRTLFAFSGT